LLRSRLLLNILANIFQVVGGAVLLFALYRYLTENLGVAAVGVWAVVMAATSLSKLADLGMTAAVTRQVAQCLAIDDTGGGARVIQTAFLSLLGALSVVLPALAFALPSVLSSVFVDSEVEDALRLLPYAVVSLGISVLSGILLSALDGVQWMRSRALIVVGAQAVLYTLAVVYVPQYGLVGVAAAQVVQGLITLVAAWILLKVRLPELPLLPYQWRRAEFLSMVGYGTKVQIGTVAILLMDPVTKVFFASFGGAAAAGYFEIASQAVSKIRALIVSANQALVPLVAGMSTDRSSSASELYTLNVRVLACTALPMFIIVYLLGDSLVSLLVTSDVEAAFHVGKFFRILLIAWLVNLIAAPAYFFNLGEGAVGVNAATHVASAVINILAGWGLGLAFGLYGVLVGYAFAVVVGSLCLAVEFTFRRRLFVWGAVAKENLGFVSIIIVVIFAQLGFSESFYSTAGGGSIVVWILIAVTGVCWWRHLLLRSLLGRIRFCKDSM
jgi:O-antigen/teichoic acid export membrane protein